MMTKHETITRNLYVVSLGCPKNLVDSEIVSGNLLSSGYSLVFEPDEADLYFINTCAFLASARNEAAREIEQAVQWKQQRPGRRIAIGGCLCAHRELEDFKKRFTEVDFWVGINDIARISELLDGAQPTNGQVKFLCNHLMPRLLFTLPHLAYLKISDGCNNRCSYCAIPDIRGNLRSRSIASVLEEARTLIANGVKELVVIAQDITVFGVDRPGSGETIGPLLRQLNALDGEFKIRLLYTHPAHYTEDFIEAVASCDKVIPYLDIPLQHISDRILRAMNRHIGQADTLKLLAHLREAIPHLTLRTTFITGLPGETEAEFQELADFAAQFRFERLGIFPYSPEPGTPAARMKDQVPAEIANARADQLLRSQKARMRHFNRKLIGQDFEVLVDSIESNWAFARGDMDAPDIDQQILIPLPRRSRIKAGQFIKVRCTGVEKGDLTAQLLPLKPARSAK